MSISSLPPSGFTPASPASGGGPINFKAAQAYAANRPAPAASTASVSGGSPIAPKVIDQVSFSAVAGKIAPQPRVGTATPVSQPTPASKARIDSIVAAKVPGKVTFDSTSSPAAPSITQTPSGNAALLPFYTNPTMKNTAATGVAASRSLDLQA